MAGRPKLREARNFLDQHPIPRYMSNLALRATLFVMFGPRKQREYGDGLGLLEGAILGNELYHPDLADPVSLTVTSADTAGHLVGYDFTRPQECPTATGPTPRLLTKGRLFGIVIDEVKDNPPDKRTPLHLLEWQSNISHALCLDRCTLGEAVDEGLIRTTTYGQAYAEVGLYDQWEEDLAHRNLLQERVHQVTPKGNTLLFLVRDSGTPSPRPDSLKSPSLAPVPAPAS